MKFSNVIELDIWSNFGCFSKPFSTTGGILSYLIPPKTSIIGMIGAILGYDFDDYEEKDSIKEYKIEKGNNNIIKIYLSSNSDEFMIYYKGTNIQNVSYLVSIITILFSIAYIIFKRIYYKNR